MNQILILFSTNAGSTAEVAETIATELRNNGKEVDVHLITDRFPLEAYGSVIIGAPMIFGWHLAVRRYIRQNRKQLAGKKMAYFACALRLTSDPHAEKIAVSLSIEPALITEPGNPAALTLKERFTMTGHYLKAMLGCVPEIKPVDVAFFYGKLDLRRLKWWQALIVLAIVQGKPGDYRDWDYIRQWAQIIQPLL